MAFKFKRKKQKEPKERLQTFSWKLNHDSNKKEFKYKLEVGDDSWYARNQKEINEFMKEPHILWHAKQE